MRLDEAKMKVIFSLFSITNFPKKYKETSEKMKFIFICRRDACTIRSFYDYSLVI